MTPDDALAIAQALAEEMAPPSWAPDLADALVLGARGQILHILETAQADDLPAGVLMALPVLVLEVATRIVLQERADDAPRIRQWLIEWAHSYSTRLSDA